jgi:hypothetical protein
MRDRIRSLFPQAYARQFNLYRIYAQADRSRRFSEWINNNVQPSNTEQPAPTSAPVPTPGPVLVPTPALISTPTSASVPVPTSTNPPAPRTPEQDSLSRIGTNPHIIQNLLRGLTQTTRSNEIRPETSDDEIMQPAVQTPPSIRYTVTTNPVRNTRIPNILHSPIFPPTNLLQSLLSLGLGVDQDMGGQVLWPDVVISPALEQIEANSELIDPIDIPVETTCAICLEHDRRGEFNTTWRRLDCTHDFHQPCIDQWFNTSVHCPVCRHDIREAV